MMAPHVQGARMVTLLDGSLTWSDSEEWRHETLARDLLRYPPGRCESILLSMADDKPETAIALRDTMATINAKARAA